MYEETRTTIWRFVFSKLMPAYLMTHVIFHFYSFIPPKVNSLLFSETVWYGWHCGLSFAFADITFYLWSFLRTSWLVYNWK